MGVVWLRIGFVLAAAAGCSGSATGGSLPRLLLPDLDQRPPQAVSVRWGGAPTDRRPLLVFTSTVENVGFGPLLVAGRRSSPQVKTIRAEQLIQLRGGGFDHVEGVGRLRYNVSPTHSHWHLLPFEQYELRTLGGRQIGRDHKTGFCLTSDYRSPLRTLARKAAHPLRTGCAKNNPGARYVFAGIAAGWGDIYIPAKEGQWIDLGGVAAGDYDLVHRVNVSRRLREANYANDAASLRIRLIAPPTPADLPTVQILKTCETGTHC
jgi:Lysyl oxidase